MLRTTRFRVIMLAVVLSIAMASVAGITFSSSSAADKGIVTAVLHCKADPKDCSPKI